MKKIVISNTKINIISVIFFFLLLILSLSYQFLTFDYLSVNVSYIFMFVIFPVTIILLHEALHYIGFLFAKIEIEQLILRPSKPYPITYISTSLHINECSYKKYFICICTFATNNNFRSNYYPSSFINS